jgi:hypothetical protein
MSSRILLHRCICEPYSLPTNYLWRLGRNLKYRGLQALSCRMELSYIRHDQTFGLWNWFILTFWFNNLLNLPI